MFYFIQLQIASLTIDFGHRSSSQQLHHIHLHSHHIYFAPTASCQATLMTLDVARRCAIDRGGAISKAYAGKKMNVLARTWRLSRLIMFWLVGAMICASVAASAKPWLLLVVWPQDEGKEGTGEEERGRTGNISMVLRWAERRRRGRPLRLLTFALGSLIMLARSIQLSGTNLFCKHTLEPNFETHDYYPNPPFCSLPAPQQI